jgi:hypothetical protein
MVAMTNRSNHSSNSPGDIGLDGHPQGVVFLNRTSIVFCDLNIMNLRKRVNDKQAVAQMLLRFPGGLKVLPLKYRGSGLVFSKRQRPLTRHFRGSTFRPPLLDLELIWATARKGLVKFKTGPFPWN